MVSFLSKFRASTDLKHYPEIVGLTERDAREFLTSKTFKRLVDRTLAKLIKMNQSKNVLQSTP